MELQRIKSEIERIKYQGGVKALAEAVGMTEQNLHRCVRENKIQAQDLEKISKELNVSISFFFDEEVSSENSNVEKHNNSKRIRIMRGNNNQWNERNSNNNTNAVADVLLSERIKSLETLIREKDERISDLKERITELKSKI